MFYLIFGETPVKRKLIFLDISGYEYIEELRKGIYNDYKAFDNIKDNDLRLWKVNTDDDKIRMLDEQLHGINILKDLNGEELFTQEKIPTKLNDPKCIIIVEPPKPATTVFENIEEVLRKAEYHWTKLKDKLVKKIELEEFRVSNHIYKDSINTSGIPVINKRPSFILHSLPDFGNKEGYISEDIFSALFNRVMEQRWLFLMGTSGSGKTRSLYELFCRTYGIYFSLNTGNGHKNNNLGSQDMDTAIVDLSYSLALDPSKSKSLENNTIALRYTRAMLLGRLFILNKLLGFHRDSNFTNFTPKQWLLIQLLPSQINDGKDFWVSIANDFRNLDPLCHNELVTTFIKEFESFVPEQKQLPIAIDESQSAISKYEKMFPPSNSEDELRPFFVILLRTVLQLITKKLCLILSGTGMSFEDIENYAPSSIAKPNGPTFEDFFSIHDGFYKDSEMSKYIQRFLPLDDESMESTFNIFRGRRQFVVQFLEQSLFDMSSMSRNVNINVKLWQRNAKNFIISTFKNDCFPKLHSKKEVWNKVMDTVILNMFSTCTMTVRGEGVIEMVQYGFAQLCDFKRLASDQDIFAKDVIEVQIAETIPFLAFREYIERDCCDRNELEKKLLQDIQWRSKDLHHRKEKL